MCIYRRGVESFFFFGYIFFYRTPCRHCLHAPFTYKTAGMGFKFFPGFQPPPKAPVMAVAVGITFRIAPAILRRSRNIGTFSFVKFFCPPGQTIPEQSYIIVPQFGRVCTMQVKLLLPAPVMPAFIHFIVAAPEYNTVVIA